MIGSLATEPALGWAPDSGSTEEYERAYYAAKLAESYGLDSKWPEVMAAIDPYINGTASADAYEESLAELVSRIPGLEETLRKEAEKEFMKKYQPWLIGGGIGAALLFIWAYNQ